mmetsp:Transcript_8218/g.16738  ORF Transcript_8218/g.16738 Transcript_8218/m.16738 type:complete len:90 (-) Transcript_8218:2173-2442(-)
MIGPTILKWIILPFIIASTALHQVGAKIQNKPLRISKDVTVMGTTYVTGEDRIAPCVNPFLDVLTLLNTKSGFPSFNVCNSERQQLRQG